MNKVPHFQVVVGACLIAIAGYLGFSIYVMGWSSDAALKGDIVGTWKSFAVLAFGFWIGSSSGGKSKPDEPQPVTVTNDQTKPVPVDPTAP